MAEELVHDKVPSTFLGGHIRTKSKMTFGGPRIIAEITEKGLDSYIALLGSLRKLAKEKDQS